MDKYDAKRAIEERVPDEKQRVINTFFFLLGMVHNDEPEFANIAMRMNDKLQKFARDDEDDRMVYLIDTLFDPKYTSDVYKKARDVFELAIDKVHHNIY